MMFLYYFDCNSDHAAVSGRAWTLSKRSLRLGRDTDIPSQGQNPVVYQDLSDQCFGLPRMASAILSVGLSGLAPESSTFLKLLHPSCRAVVRALRHVQTADAKPCPVCVMNHFTTPSVIPMTVNFCLPNCKMQDLKWFKYDPLWPHIQFWPYLR